MKYSLFTIFDKEANETVGSPFESKNENVARRHYWTFVNNYKVKSNEFSLWKVGEFDSEANKLISLAFAEQVAITDNGDDKNE